MIQAFFSQILVEHQFGKGSVYFADSGKKFCWEYFATGTV